MNKTTAAKHEQKPFRCAVLIGLIFGSYSVIAEQPAQLDELSPTQEKQQVTEVEISHPKENLAAEILQIQFDLRKLGYYKNELNGVLDRATRDSIRVYQLEHVLDIDGEWSLQLKGSLSKATGRL
ncbi:MAG: peptidoglycan-binding protein [Pseudomonadales bacterium]|nr:peptidoglycan-binding protein [Pseudomonadales bacterium]